METNSRFGQWISRISDRLSDHVWFQQLKTKWEELDPKSRTYIRGTSLVGILLLALFMVISSFWRVHSLKVEVAEKSELLQMIQAANTEMKKLRESTPGAGRPTDANAAWPAYFESTATTSGIDKGNLTVSAEKSGDSSEQTQESLFEVTLKHVNIKQVVRFSFYLEYGGRAVKVRNLSIDTKNDPTGYIDAVLSVSGFTSKQQGS